MSSATPRQVEEARHEAWCGRIGDSVSLVKGVCPECGWFYKRPATATHYEIEVRYPGFSDTRWYRWSGGDETRQAVGAPSGHLPWEFPTEVEARTTAAGLLRDEVMIKRRAQFRLVKVDRAGLGGVTP